VISPGVDLEQFKPMDKSVARTKLGLPENERQVLFVGRIESLKGIDTLIRASHLMVASGELSDRPFRVQIIGGDAGESLELLGSEMSRLRRLSIDLGLENCVRFLGSRRQRDLPTYYAAADAVVMPSYSESFGMVALETMACGRPVIASRVGGLAYLVQDGVTGFHVQEGDASEMAERLAKMLRDKELLERMGLAARAEAERYSWEKTANEVVNLFNKLL
jgi:D-inositol-3-phosphate glycosyltransferase